jgi:thiamine pyrophosphate-dependent acetolactate synthase large subunit-like protein
MEANQRGAVRLKGVFMNVFWLLGHIGLLLHCEQDVQGIVENLIKQVEKFPSKQEFVELIDDAIQILGSGLLSLPDDVLKKFVDSLNGVKAQLVPVPVAQK